MKINIHINEAFKYSVKYENRRPCLLNFGMLNSNVWFVSWNFRDEINQVTNYTSIYAGQKCTLIVERNRRVPYELNFALLQQHCKYLIILRKLINFTRSIITSEGKTLQECHGYTEANTVLELMHFIKKLVIKID